MNQSKPVIRAQQFILKQCTPIRKNTIVFQTDQTDFMFKYITFMYSKKKKKWFAYALHKKKKKLYKFTSNVHMIMVFTDLTKDQENNQKYLEKIVCLVDQYKQGCFSTKSFDVAKLYSIL